MFSRIVLILIVFSLSLVCMGYADDLEIISFTSPKKSDWNITVKGHFSKPGIVEPNETIFSLVAKHTRIRLARLSGFDPQNR